MPGIELERLQTFQNLFILQLAHFASFLAFLAAFFSFGDIAGVFLLSLLPFFSLLMIFSPYLCGLNCYESTENISANFTESNDQRSI